MLAKNSEKEGMSSGSSRMGLLVRKRFPLLLRDSLSWSDNQIGMWESDRRKTNLSSHIWESYAHKRFKGKRVRWGMNTCPPELRNGAGTWVPRGGGDSRTRRRAGVEWLEVGHSDKGAPGTCPPPGKTPFSIFLGNWRRGRCFSRLQSLSCLRLRMTHRDGACWERSFWTPSRGCWPTSFSSVSSLGIFVGIRRRKHYMAYVLGIQWTCLLA